MEAIREFVIWPLANRLMWWRRLHRPVIRVRMKLYGDTPRYRWPIVAGSVTNKSIVYSFGIGTNATFEESLVAEYGCHVFAFDPTPKSVAWAREQSFDPRLRFIELGLWIENGELRFFEPAEHNDVSCSMRPAGDRHAGYVVAQVRTLPTLMNELGHRAIDILKMDVEGAEHDVLEQLADTEIRPRQLLVEFHHGFYGTTAEMTKRTVGRLRTLGYETCWVSDRGLEYAFVLRRFASEGTSAEQ
jgi:FkbM family methyltransferase